MMSARGSGWLVGQPVAALGAASGALHELGVAQLDQDVLQVLGGICWALAICSALTRLGRGRLGRCLDGVLPLGWHSHARIVAERGWVWESARSEPSLGR
jgi:hypothetical protein